MKLAKIILPCLLALVSGTSVQACDNSLALAYLFGYGGFNGRSLSNNQIPHFSLHPPVYYGERYYRPYGASPFAAWPQLQPNPNYIPQARSGLIQSAVVISNPHFHAIGPAAQGQPASGGSSESAPVRVPNVVLKSREPAVIDNPYFIEEESKLATR